MIYTLLSDNGNSKSKNQKAGGTPGQGSSLSLSMQLQNNGMSFMEGVQLRDPKRQQQQ